MVATAPKPLIWFLEEATPEVAHLMHELEGSLGGSASVQRVSYMDALRDLPRKDVRQGLSAVIVFSVSTLHNLARLMRGHQGPRLCFFPPRYEAFAELKAALRWAGAVTVVARHLGEAQLAVASGFKPEHIVRLQADIQPAALPDRALDDDRPLRVGFAWYNLAPSHRDRLAGEIARWQQSAPGRCEWHAVCLPDDVPPTFEGATIHTTIVTTELLAENAGPALDVWLTDPWWPDALPRPCRAPVHLFLPPGGASGEYWHDRLQSLVNLAEDTPWGERLLLNFRYQPLWKHLLKGETRELPELPEPDLAELAAIRDRLSLRLGELRAEWPAEGPTPEEQAHYFWRYDHAVHATWCLDLWRTLQGARNGKRHALLLAFNALPLHHTGTSWLFKRLLARTPLGEGLRERRFTRAFWSRVAWRHKGLMARWVRTLLACGRDPANDPLAVGREIATAILEGAHVTIERRNEPAPVPGVPTIYLLSHRHADLDPFLLLHVLPGALAVVVGPRAQRWPFMKRLEHHSAFVLTGRERGVVNADAIAAVRARRALALYPEVSEPTYLGEGAPLRSGLLWIVQALERSQVIPVVLDDAFTLGPEGGTVSLWFGEPIACTPATGEALLNQVRWFFHQHLAKMSAPGREAPIERRIPAAAATAESQPQP
jgi:hypothetical protein